MFNLHLPDQRDVARGMEIASLAGVDVPNYLGEVDRAIGELKRHRANLQALLEHAHRWNEDDYCNICGADGRA